MIPEGDDVVLRFSFIGKRTKEIKYTGQKTLRVTLEDDSQQLEEVTVVNEGYQKIDKTKTDVGCYVIENG